MYSALLSTLIVFVAVLLKNRRVKRADVELWIAALEKYVAARTQPTP